jgi:hypothetical protein
MVGNRRGHGRKGVTGVAVGVAWGISCCCGLGVGGCVSSWCDAWVAFVLGGLAVVVTRRTFGGS